MWHTFLCFIILAKWRFCRNFDPLIFTLFLLHIDFATLFLHFFLFQCLSFLLVKQQVLKKRGPFFARKKKLWLRILNLGYSWANTAGILYCLKHTSDIARSRFSPPPPEWPNPGGGGRTFFSDHLSDKIWTYKFAGGNFSIFGTAKNFYRTCGVLPAASGHFKKSKYPIFSQK